MNKKLHFCFYCNNWFIHPRSLTSHISNDHNMTIKEYYDIFIRNWSIDDGLCLFCGLETNFYNLKNGYTKYCSERCSSSDRTQTEETKKRISSANKKLSESSKVKREKTNLEKYGVENPFQSEEIKEKIKETCLEKYGVGNPSQLEEIKEKTKETNLKKYGVEILLKSKEIREKIRQTCIKKYGVEYPSQLEKIKEKIKETNLEKYGVEYPSKSEEIKRKIADKQTINFYKNILLNNKDFIPMFGPEEYEGVSYIKGIGYKRYLWKCKKCGNIFEDHLQGKVCCKICEPKDNKNSSIMEKELFEFISSYIPSEKNKRFFKDKQYELDIYIPSLKLGIEFDGIYWHSELAGKTKRYHIDKTNWFKENFDIEVIHVFENEWVLKKDIVKSIILNRLGLNSKKIYARKCKLVELNTNIYKKFLDKNHIQGGINSSKRFGLLYDNELVSIIGFGKSRFRKNEYELIRYVNKINTSVIGGFSKLIKNSGIMNFITYCDLRYFNAHGYEAIGFVEIGRSEPNYFYFKNNNCDLKSRVQFQKHKLKDKLEFFDPNLTEWENMRYNGWNRIWDCGNIKLEYVK